jgi:hypothetical protein
MGKTIAVPILNDAVANQRALRGGAQLLERAPGAAPAHDDPDNEPVVQLSAAAYTVSEAAGVATITVVRSGSTAPFTVSYYTSSGTASYPGDFTYTSGTLSFAAGVMSKAFTVQITLDSVIEPSEYFYLYL